MEPKVEKLEHEKEKLPYEAPKLTRHGSVEQITGDCDDPCDSGQTRVLSGVFDDTGGSVL